MLRIIITLLLLGTGFLTACQSGATQAQEKAAKAKPNIPQLKKIMIENRAEADSLMAEGFELLVVEDDYVVVRLKTADSTKVNALGVTPLPIIEQDLVQRLVKIPIAERKQIQKLADIGMDIWEAHEDTVVAQVFDKHIRDAQKQGFDVIVVEKNVLNLVQQQDNK